MYAIELPVSVYHRLQEVALANGVSAADWIAGRLPPIDPAGASPSESEIQIANAGLFACRVTMDDPAGIDNERIDADLLQAYAEDAV